MDFGGILAETLMSTFMPLIIVLIVFLVAYIFIWPRIRRFRERKEIIPGLLEAPFKALVFDLVTTQLWEAKLGQLTDTIYIVANPRYPFPQYLFMSPEKVRFFEYEAGKQKIKYVPCIGYKAMLMPVDVERLGRYTLYASTQEYGRLFTPEMTRQLMEYVIESTERKIGVVPVSASTRIQVNIDPLVLLNEIFLETLDDATDILTSVVTAGVVSHRMEQMGIKVLEYAFRFRELAQRKWVWLIMFILALAISIVIVLQQLGG